MNHFEATGSFSFTRVRQEMVTKSKRDAVDFLSLPEVVESSLMAIINHSKGSSYKVTVTMAVTMCCPTFLAHIDKHTHTQPP